MIALNEFLGLVNDELGIDADSGDLDRPLDQLPGWDSVLLLKLITVLETATATPQSLPALLHSANLRQLQQNVRVP